MAFQLIARGKVVELVAILDAATPQAARRVKGTAKKRLRRLSHLFARPNEEMGFAEWMSRIIGAVCMKSINTLRWEVTNWCKKLSVRARFRLLRRIVERGDAWPAMVTKLSARQIYESAEAGYVPKTADITNLLVVRAMSGEGGDTPYAEIYSDPTLGWGAISSNVTVVDVEGGHFTMLQEAAVDDLARVLNGALASKAASDVARNDTVEELV
jgi:thioesterase domain-containing protein